MMMKASTEDQSLAHNKGQGAFANNATQDRLEFRSTMNAGRNTASGMSVVRQVMGIFCQSFFFSRWRVLHNAQVSPCKEAHDFP